MKMKATITIFALTIVAYISLVLHHSGLVSIQLEIVVLSFLVKIFLTLSITGILSHGSSSSATVPLPESFLAADPEQKLYKQNRPRPDQLPVWSPSIRFMMVPTVSATDVIAGFRSSGEAISIPRRASTTSWV